MDNNRSPEVSPDLQVEDMEWDNPREKRNPKNWPLWKKLFHTAVPCILAFVM
jgi:hypothetical protein